MRILRAFYAIVALVAVALLPGPSHALAAASAARPVMHDRADLHHVGHHHASAATHEAMTACEHEHGSPKRCPPCKSCALACCAPVTAAVAAPLLAAVDPTPLRRQRPEPDLARQGATSPPAFRPPAFRSA